MTYNNRHLFDHNSVDCQSGLCSTRLLLINSSRLTHVFASVGGETGNWLAPDDLTPLSGASAGMAGKLGMIALSGFPSFH